MLCRNPSRFYFTAWQLTSSLPTTASREQLEVTRLTRLQQSKAYWRRSAAQLLLLDHVRQIVLAADALNLHAGQILTAAHAHQHDVMFLQIVPNAGYVRYQLLAGRQPHQHTLAVGGVGLLRLLDQRLQHDALRERFPVQWLAGRSHLKVGPRSVHLVEGGHGAALQKRGDRCKRRKEERGFIKASRYDRSDWWHVCVCAREGVL